MNVRFAEQVLFVQGKALWTPVLVHLVHIVRMGLKIDWVRGVHWGHTMNTKTVPSFQIVCFVPLANIVMKRGCLLQTEIVMLDFCVSMGRNLLSLTRGTINHVQQGITV